MFMSLNNHTNRTRWLESTLPLILRYSSLVRRVYCCCCCCDELTLYRICTVDLWDATSKTTSPPFLRLLKSKQCF